MDGVRTPVTDLVNAGAEPVFAFYLEDQVDEKLTINGVNSAHYTENFACTRLENTKNYYRSHCWLQNRPDEVSLTRRCSMQAGKAGCFQPSHASFPQNQVRPMRVGSQSSREHWVQRFCFRGRSDHTIGASRWLWSDRPLAVSSVKTSHYPTHGAITPSIQEEGEEHIFRVREFQFLLGKICVAHSVTHSFTLLLCCALSVEFEIPPASPRRYSKYRRSASHRSPSETCVNQKRPGRG